MLNVAYLITTLLLCICTVNTALAATLPLSKHVIHYESWGSETQLTRPTVVLLSGPIDSWHSDSAWWAGIGPQLAKDYRVIALDRAGQVLANPEVEVGYARFADDMAEALAALQVKDALLVAFASSNISAQLYLQRHPQQQAINQVIMIDPDVLSDFSIARYKKDAAPFKQQLSAYMEYIKAQKYTARTAQKNAADKALLEKLAQPQQDVDWAYVDKLMNARLLIDNQLNLFREIARYGEDLDAAAAVGWPAAMPLIVIDTDFEQLYIDNEQDPQEQAGLQAWQQDAERYYRQISALHPSSRYLASGSSEHLYPFADPAGLLELIRQWRVKQFGISAGQTPHVTPLE